MSRNPNDPSLALVSFALAPGPGGPEAAVTREFVRAVADHWTGSTHCYSAGDEPNPFGVSASSPATTASEARPATTRVWQALCDQAAASRWSVGRAVSRLLYERSGYSIKYHAWERWLQPLLEQQLDRDPNTVVLSRALPLCSLHGAHRVLRSRPHRWIVNINDPCPPGVWPGVYPIDQKTRRLQARSFERLLSRINGFTFPSRRLFEVHAKTYPQVRDRPVRIVPHLAPPLPAQSVPAEPTGPKERRSAERPLRLGFAGTLRSDLPHAALLDALRSLDPPTSVEILASVGQLSPALERFAQVAPCEVTIETGLDGESIDHNLQRMDALLCIEAEIDSPLLLTKLVSYLRFGKPILGICARDGTSEGVLKRIDGGMPVTFDNAEEIAAAIRQLQNFEQIPAASAGPQTETTARFEPATAIETVRRLLSDIEQGRTGLQGPSWP